ncbi:hypothetical protein [Bacillus infantis]|uniref:Uncharacterized protein n=1 Tax=Bacillus infantis TaxID=324767 RepID=A0A5D4RDR7_9BACI|nr:hypothetical protein [Bacillus infantis]TYS48006.1 hypothetical protein FZD51_13905 [Bacillus infantis]
MLRSSVYREDDYHMLKQKIIHLNSELSRYKAKVKEYQDDYHYSQLETLKEKNLLLEKELAELVHSRDEERKAFVKKHEEESRNSLSSISHLEDYIGDLEEKCSKSSERIIELEEELLTQGEANDRLQAELAEFKEKTYPKQEEVVRLKAELKAVEKSLEDQLEEFNILKKDRNRLLEDNNQLVQMQQNTMNELLSFRTKIGMAIPVSKERENSTLSPSRPENKDPGLTDKLKQLQGKVKEYESSISICLQQITELEGQIGLLSAFILKMEAISPENFKHH